MDAETRKRVLQWEQEKYLKKLAVIILGCKFAFKIGLPVVTESDFEDMKEDYKEQLERIKLIKPGLVYRSVLEDGWDKTHPWAAEGMDFAYSAIDGEDLERFS